MSFSLITGASSGIGRDLAILLAQDRHDLVVTARDKSALEKLAEECRTRYGVNVRVLAKDLAEPNAPQQIFDELSAAGIQIDILINNAGFGTHGFFAERNLADDLRLIQVNIAALTALTRLFLPAMIERKSGRIMNVASTAAFVPGPYMSTYYASKAYVLSFSAALTRELRKTGVTVTALCPGPTRTNFQERAGINHVRLFEGRGIMDSPDVARIGYRGMMRGKAIVVPGWTNKLIAIGSRLVSRSILARVAGSLNSGR